MQATEAEYIVNLDDIERYASCINGKGDKIYPSTYLIIATNTLFKCVIKDVVDAINGQDISTLRVVFKPLC